MPWNRLPCCTERGAEAEVVARADHLNWLHGGKYHRKLGRLAPLSTRRQMSVRWGCPGWWPFLISSGDSRTEFRIRSPTGRSVRPVQPG